MDFEQFATELTILIRTHRPSIHQVQTLLSRLDNAGYFKKGKENKNPDLQTLKFNHTQGGCQSCQK